MKLTMRPTMWASIGPEGRPDLFKEENAIQYVVIGFPDVSVCIQAETSAQHRGEWHIVQNGVKDEQIYESAQAALQALQAEAE